MNVPLAKPCLCADEYAALKPVLDSGWLGMGATVGEFEGEVKKFIGCEHCIAVNTGTSALHLALETVDVRDREVIVPSMTFAATVQAILAAGGLPVFAECREADLNLDVKDALQRVTPRTRAILPVHYAGTPVDMDSLLAEAQERGLVVIEDAAHAFGTCSRGRKIGSFGHVTCFSFDPIKTVTCGEGGAVCTANSEWAETMRRKRVLGISKDTWDRYKQERPWSYRVIDAGFRYHMSNLNAAIGVVQMRKVEFLIEERRRVVRQYDEAFARLPGVKLLCHDLEADAPFCYTFRVLDGKRDSFMAAMKGVGVGTGVLYLPNHDQPAFAAYRGSLPRTEALAEEFVSLPLYGGMTPEETSHVTTQVRAFFAGA